MLKISKHCLAFLIASCVLFASPLRAADPVKGNLVSVNWLEKNLKDADLLILDASAAQIYRKEHIPAALNVDLFSYGALEPSVPEMEQRLQSVGVSRGKKILIYDQGGSFMAPRLFYDLYYYGYPAKDLLILDGGLAKWKAAGGSITKDLTPAPQKGSFRITTINEYARVKLPEILTASGDTKNNALVEALDANWHFGGLAFFDRPGHIPNGIMLPSEDFFNADKTFKSAEEIKRIATYLGIKPEQQIYSYCGGGIAATVPFFALKFLADYPQVKLYQESLLGWLQDERGLPLRTYVAPLLMRETSWLKTWSGKMMRTYDVSRVSVIDVRPADAFKQGHMPYALNIPADVFKGHLKSPEKLAEILGQAGVNASHEAVVISDAGLSRRSNDTSSGLSAGPTMTRTTSSRVTASSLFRSSSRPSPLGPSASKIAWRMPVKPPVIGALATADESATRKSSMKPACWSRPAPISGSGSSSSETSTARSTVASSALSCAAISWGFENRS